MITKKYTKFRPKIRSRHPSHKPLRQKNLFPLLPFKSIVRFGSTTPSPDGNRIELNEIKGIQNSSNKILMKRCFSNENVKTADWFQAINLEAFTNIKTNIRVDIKDMPFPIIAKHKYGSRGRGNTKLDDLVTLKEWLEGKRLENYIFEKYYNFVREYRLHVNEDGCFYTCRKMLKKDTPAESKWFRNDANCVWILEENENFDKPSNWDNIVKESVNALKSVGLDFGAIDLRIQSAKHPNGDARVNPEFIIVEINSAPSFGKVTITKYIEEIPKMLIKKYQNK